MKIHRTLAEAVIQTLQRIFLEKIYADKAVEQVLKQNSRWGSRDRRFIAETTYEMVRWWRLILETTRQQDAETVDFWQLFAAWQVIKGNELPDWDEFAQLDKTQLMNNYNQAKQVRKFRESVPDWLDELGASELTDAVWEKELAALNKEADVVLRVNTLKTNLSKLKIELLEQQVETHTDSRYPQGLILDKRKHVQQLDAYKHGLFEIQDASSQLIAPFLDLQPGFTVVDACAGAGGKSLHMAAMLENKGTIISMDVEERKLLELKRRAERAGAKNIQTQLISDSAISKLNKKADRLLLDVPCSGLGVIRRNPDAKWKLSSIFIKEVQTLQQKIITNYSQMLKPGGTMVYATCSILPGENQHQVQLFLEKNKDFEFIEDRKIMPSEGFDGFYMAKLKRTN